MDRVAEHLFVGSIEDAGDASLLRKHSVDMVVSLTYTGPEAGFPDSVSVAQYAMMDGPRNEKEVFKEAVEAIVRGLESGKTVLVHCSRGASRSPAVAAVAVALHQGIDIEDTFELIRERRDVVDPHDALVEQAVEVYGTLL
jgi:protein-tyrosine phosphatase